MSDLNPILITDSYKSSHFLQYPPNTDGMFSYLESRGGKYKETLFFGLQYIVSTYLMEPITYANLVEARDILEEHGLPFPFDAWDRVISVHDGYIPVRIKAVKEGTVVPVSNVLMTVESTDPQLFWMVNWVEALLHRVWYPITVATQSMYIKRIIKTYLDMSADDPEAEIDFKLHDFGARGVSSHESAGLGGAAHLVSFKGTDTLEAIKLARSHYFCPMAGYSIPAAEHSTITSWGRGGEEWAYANMVSKFSKPGKLLAVVSDSYDLFAAIEHIWCDGILDEVKNSGGTVVIRPDSGDPAEIVLQCLKLMDEKLGGLSKNSKGYKILPSYFRLIQGDGVNIDSISEILAVITQAGYSASNIAFGMGGAMLQKVDRDVQKFAYKCSEITINGMSREVYKDPVTDPGKVSKRGRLDLIEGPNGPGTFATVSGNANWLSLLETVYEDGHMRRWQRLDDIRAIAKRGL